MAEPVEMTDLERLKESVIGIEKANEFQAARGIEEGTVLNEALDIAVQEKPNMPEELMDVITNNVGAVLEKAMPSAISNMEIGDCGNLTVLFRASASEGFNAVNVKFNNKGELVSSETMGNNPETIGPIVDAIAKDAGWKQYMDEGGRVVPVVSAGPCGP